MKQSQAEIKAIQAKLQAIQAGRASGRPPSLPAMVELTPNSATATLPRNQEEETITAAAENLQQRSSTYVRQFQQLQPQVQSQPPRPQRRESPEQQIAEALRRLETQAQRINDLSVAQEAALLELKAIAEKAERDWKAAELEHDLLLGADAEIPPICDYQPTAVPYIEKDENGAFVLTARSIDLFRAEREATLTAQALRHRPATSGSGYGAPRRKSSQAQRHSSDLQNIEVWGRAVWKQVTAFIRSLNSARANAASLKTSRTQPAQPVEMPNFSVQDAVIWVLGAVVARVGLDLLLTSFPWLWLPVVGLIAFPAATAVYRTTVAPHSGLVWGYRLLLVMIGLLLGGRL